MSEVSIPIPVLSFKRLISFLDSIGSDRDPVAVVDDALDYWIENASWKTQDLLPELHQDAGHGYKWKIQQDGDKPASMLFLPEGTTLRITIRGSNEFASIEGDAIIYNESEVRSPNEFALNAAGHQRDAWRDVWIKRPNDKSFHLADDLRTLARRQS